LTDDLKLQKAHLKNNWECFKDYISVEKDILEQQEYEKFRIDTMTGVSDESIHQIRYENWQELTT
jgi:predicted transcriptional regulator